MEHAQAPTTTVAASETWWSTPGAVSIHELALATRNHGQPLEALADDITPLGLHYLLTHFDIPHVTDPAAWRVQVGGAVRRRLSLSLADLRSRPRVTQPVTMECAGNGRARISERMKSQPWLEEAVGTGEWTGTPLRPLLEEAGIGDGSVQVLFSGVDRGIQGGVEHDYERSLPLAEALRDEVMLAYEVNGQPLPPQHGFPIRLIVPGWYGMTNVKWLRAITVLTEPFEGFQQVTGYTIKRGPDDPGVEVTRMQPRSLMIPPGIPEYVTRRRVVDAGRHVLRGRAWSGWAPIARVEVSVDGGATWQDAELRPSATPYSWATWSYEWGATTPGEYELQTRATDQDGNAQPFLPDDADNPQGLANTHLHSVHVTVR